MINLSKNKKKNYNVTFCYLIKNRLCDENMKYFYIVIKKSSFIYLLIFIIIFNLINNIKLFDIYDCIINSYLKVVPSWITINNQCKFRHALCLVYFIYLF